MNDLKCFLVSDCDWVICRTPAEAIALSYGMDIETPIEQILDPGEGPIEEIAVELAMDEIIVYVDEGVETPKTAAEWIAEHGAGFLCTTEF